MGVRRPLMPQSSECTLFVSNSTSPLPFAYSRIADLILAGARNHYVGVVLATDSEMSLVTALSQPSAQLLKQLKSDVRDSDRFKDSVAAKDDLTRFLQDALQFALQLPLFSGANKKNLVILTGGSGDEHCSTVELSAELEKWGVEAYAIGAGKASIGGLSPPPWIGSKSIPPPMKTVSTVKTFEGNFTIGDPSSPLVAVSVVCYPATRRATVMTPSTFHGEHAAVSSYQMQTSEGPPNRAEDVQRGFTYLSELVTANSEVQKLMDGEFPGAEVWPRAFELLATVPKVPPWIPLGSSDVIIGKDESATAFIAALHAVLKERSMHAIARMSKGGRKGYNKGTVELSLIQPFEHDLLLRTPLPYKEDFRSYYRFSEIPSQPESGDDALDAKMDDLVANMQTKMPPVPRNPAISRLGEFIRACLVNDSAVVPTLPPLFETPDRPLCRKQSLELSTEFGIAEQVRTVPAAAEPSQEVSYQATQTEINIDDLL